MKTAHPKRRAMKAMKAMKAMRPMEARKAAPDEAPERKKYWKMFYKNSHSVGIKESTGKKRQVFSFGGAKSRKLSKPEMCKIGDEVLGLLHAQDPSSHKAAKKFGQDRSEGKA